MKMPPLRDCDESAILNIMQEPMKGNISWSFGFTDLSAPPECSELDGFGIEVDGDLMGCFLRWNWPNGDRYLAGLRFSHGMPVRPTPRFWKLGFERILDGVAYAWTSIGADNQKARKMLEHEASWLPNYYPCQGITTWFIPSRSNSSNGKDVAGMSGPIELVPGDFRYVAVSSGSGMTYYIGRMLHLTGFRGIPPPGERIHIAYVKVREGIPAPEASQALSKLCASAHGYDGLVIAAPSDAEFAIEWEKSAPGYAWKWLSQLYCVSWDKLDTVPTIPRWNAWWL